MKIIILFLILSFSGVSVFTSAQKKSLQVGGKIINEFTFNNGIAPGFGGQLIYKMGTHGGFESGLIYQSRSTGFYTFLQYGNISNYYFLKIAEHWFQIPLLYHFDSRIINFSIGPSMNYFLGWKVRYKDPALTVDSYDRKTVSLNGSAGISRSFHLSASMILEPEIKLNYIFSDDDGGIAINVALRKKLF